MVRKNKLFDCPLRSPGCEKRSCAWPTLAEERCKMLEVFSIFGKAFQLNEEEERRRKRETDYQEKLLRPGEAARILGVHATTLRRWSDKGMVKTYYVGRRGDRRFRRKDIVDFLNRPKFDR